MRSLLTHGERPPVGAVAALVLAVATLPLDGCARQTVRDDRGTSRPATSAPSPVGPPSVAPGDDASSVGKTTFAIFVSGSDEKVHPVRRTVGRTTAQAHVAMEALLEGPTVPEEAAGLGTTIPTGTRLRSVSIAGGIATVDLTEDFGSGGGTLSMMMRVAQVVHTLTQFQGVTGVRFQLEGATVDALGGEGIVLEGPQTRTDWEGFAPAILVERPLRGDVVRSPLRVRGTANVFEAVFQLELTDGDGLIVASQQVHAASGTGTRGAFDVTLRFTPSRAGSGGLVASYRSPKDGSRVVVSEIPVQVE